MTDKTAGVLGVMAAPLLAAIGALVALLKDCTIHVEREGPAVAASVPTRSAMDTEC